MKRRFAQHPLSPRGLRNGKALPSDLTSAPIIHPAGRTQLHTPSTPNLIKFPCGFSLESFSMALPSLPLFRNVSHVSLPPLATLPKSRQMALGPLLGGRGAGGRPQETLTFSHSNHQPSLHLTCINHPWNWRDADFSCVSSLDFFIHQG